MSDIDAGTTPVVEPDFADRQTHEIRVSQTAFLTMLKNTTISEAAALGIDVSLIQDIPIENMGWTFVGGVIFVTFNETFTAGLSREETLIRVKAQAQVAKDAAVVTAQEALDAAIIEAGGTP